MYPIPLSPRVRPPAPPDMRSPGLLRSTPFSEKSPPPPICTYMCVYAYISLMCKRTGIPSRGRGQCLMGSAVPFQQCQADSNGDADAGRIVGVPPWHPLSTKAALRSSVGGDDASHPVPVYPFLCLRTGTCSMIPPASGRFFVTSRPPPPQFCGHWTGGDGDG